MDRICPRCKKILSNSEFFFCLNCGYKLEDFLILSLGTASIKSKEIDTKPLFYKKQTAKINRLTGSNFKTLLKPVLVVLVLLFFTSIVVLLAKFMLLNPKPPVQQVTNENKRIYQNTVSLDDDILTGTFFSDEIGYFAPFDASFYIEGFDFSKLIKKDLPENITASDLDSILSYIDGHYIIFGKSINEKLTFGAAFSLADNIDFSIINLDFSDKIYADVFEGFLIISDDKDMLSELKLNFSKQQKSLMHNPSFITEKNVLDREGKLIFINLCKYNIEDIVSFLYNYLSSGKPTELLSKITKFGYNKFVIK